MNYVIMTDSAANLTNDMIEQNEIEILSLTYMLNGKQYLSYEKGKESDLKHVYDLMRNKTPVTTACLNAVDCYETFNNVLKQGLDLYYIGFSSGLSLSYDVASQQLEKLKEVYPQRKIFCTDSLSASMGQGRLVTYACELRAQGGEIEFVYDWIEENKLNLRHLFTVSDLAYLYRGGRVTKSAYLIATTINIKPVLHVDNQGHLVALGKTLGRKQSLVNIASRLAESIINPEEQTIYISHGDCLEDVEFLIEKIKEKVKVKGFVINYVDLVIGAHSGPGTVAVFFLANGR